MVGPVAVLVEGAAEHVVFVADGRGRVVAAVEAVAVEVVAVGGVAVGDIAIGDIICVHAFTVAWFARGSGLNE